MPVSSWVCLLFTVVFMSMVHLFRVCGAESSDHIEMSDSL